jgi:hypothetical protein
LAVALAGLGVLGTADAHTKSYVNVTGDVVLSARFCDDLVSPSQGGVCYPGGHIRTDDGVALVGIADQTTQPTSGCYQQDLGFTCQRFCGSIVLSKNGNWFPDRRVEIFVDGPVWGNPLTSPCGFRHSQGTWGHVWHT